MSIGQHPFDKLSTESTKDYKIYKVYEQLKKKMACQTKTKLSAEAKEATDQFDKPEGIVEFIWEGDIEDRINLMLPGTITVEECKASILKGLGIPEKNITLIKDGRKLKSKDKIIPGPDAKIVVEIALDDLECESEVEPTEIQRESEAFVVSTETGSSGSAVPAVKVQMLRESSGRHRYKEEGVTKHSNPQEYFGGYRNKLTGKVYHHAKVQTLPRGCAESNLTQQPNQKRTSDRETQTLLPLVDQGINTLVEKCTQMSGTGVNIPAITDKIKTARPYQEYDVINKTMYPVEAVIILQRAWRRYINMKKVSQTYKSIYDDVMAKKQFKGSSLVEFHKQQLALLTKASFPTSRSDFYNLYTVLGEWMLKQKKDLATRKLGFAHMVEMADLQKKQTRGVLAIEGHRIQAKKENLQKQDIMFLEGTARSRVRTYPKGTRTFIDDLNIKRAREIKEMYASYVRTDVTDAERIEILTFIKDCLAGFEAVDLTEDLIELLDREIDLITMGIDKRNMEYLRKRFESLYINLAKNSDFNPQAKYYRKSADTENKYAMHRCVNCNKVFHPSYMFMHLRMSRFRTCMSCSYMHSTATASINLAPYKKLLNSLRTAETEKGSRSAIPFLLQPMGMYFLVNVLWDGRSIISGSSYLPGLKVTRWIPNEEWSMWNMILLTELEAHKHETLVNPLEYYSEEFVLNVMNRNILGRIHFRMVADIDTKFRKREAVGVMPKNHLLYTTKKSGVANPGSNSHPLLVPSNATYGGHTKAHKKT